jgi:hypothetical protein
MTATPSTANATTVPVPEPAHLGAIVRQLEADHDLGRLSRAVVVLLTRDIRETPTCGVYQVQGCDTATWYTASTFGCSCPDAALRGVLCKHSLALTAREAAS